MTPATDVVLTGQKELLHKLMDLPNKVFRKCLTSASRKAMKPVIAQARATVAVESGALKRSIGLRTKVYKRQGAVVTVVGARGGFGMAFHGRNRNPAMYSHLVEKGHRIVARGSMTMVAKKKGGGLTKLRGSGTELGNVPAMPFLRPALENSHSSVVNALRDEIGSFIAKEAAK